MAKFTLWEGTRSPHGDKVAEVEVEGELAGEVKEASEKVKKETSVYRLTDGRLAVHEVRSLLQEETTHARVHVFASIAAAWPNFGWELEMVGLRPRRAILHMPEDYD